MEQTEMYERVAQKVEALRDLCAHNNLGTDITIYHSDGSSLTIDLLGMTDYPEVLIEEITNQVQVYLNERTKS